MYTKVTAETVLANLQTMVGKKFDYENIICAFEDFEEDGKTCVIVEHSMNDGYDYVAYINAEESTQFLFCVDEQDLITDVSMF